MTKVRVLSRFHDENNYAIVYEVGQVADFMDEKRVSFIVEHGLGEIVKEEQKNVVVKEVETEETTEKPKSVEAIAETVTDNASKPKKRRTKGK